MLIEHGPVPIGLLGIRNVVAPLGLGVLHHLIRNMQLGVVLERVDPAVTHAVGELLLLAPEDLVGEIRRSVGLVGGVEGLAKDVLLNAVLGDHLLRGVNVHGHLEELLVQEGDAGLHAPCRGGLVGAQAVREMQVLDATDRLLVERGLVGRVVEVQVSAEDFVAAFAGEDHFHAHGLDFAGQQEHWGGGADGGHVVGFEVVDDVREGVETLLDCEGEGMVAGSEEIGHLLCGDGIRGVGKTDGEGVQLGQHLHGGQLVVVVDTDEMASSVTVGLITVGALGPLLRLLVQAESLALGDGGDQAGIQTAGEQYTVGHLSHQSLPHRLLQSFPELLVVDGCGGDVVWLDQPLGVEVPGETVRLGVVDVARREGDDVVAHRVQTLQLGGKEDCAGGLARPAHVECSDANGVSRCENSVLGLVVKHPGEHAVEVARRVNVMLEILVHISLGTSLVRFLSVLTNGMMTSQSECVLKL